MPPTGTYQPLTTSYSLLPQQQYYVASYPYQTHAVGNNENEHFSSIETFALFFSIIIQWSHPSILGQLLLMNRIHPMQQPVSFHSSSRTCSLPSIHSFFLQTMSQHIPLNNNSNSNNNIMQIPDMVYSSPLRKKRISFLFVHGLFQIPMDMIRITLINMVKLVRRRRRIRMNYPHRPNRQKKAHSTVNYPPRLLHSLRQLVQQAQFLSINLYIPIPHSIHPNKIEQWLIHQWILV